MTRMDSVKKMASDMLNTVEKVMTERYGRPLCPDDEAAYLLMIEALHLSLLVHVTARWQSPDRLNEYLETEIAEQ